MQQRLFSATVFFSAFLLFLVQPMLAKMLLPHVGGAPSVWVVSMLFFQVMLLLGYGYAAATNAWLSPKTQACVHIALMLAAMIAYLPLTLPEHTQTTGQAPEMLLLAALFFCVALPYFALAAHNSLLQRWYFYRFGVPPYPLFAVSNAGSFAGLIGYPFLVEWLLPLSSQTWVWSAGFAALFLMVATAGFCLPRKGTLPQHAETGTRLKPSTIFWIVLLGFIPSSLFLSTTLYITSDIASFPLLWVIPLGMYLLSFVIAFGTNQEDTIKRSQRLHPLAVVGLLLSGYFTVMTASLLLLFLLFFIIAVSCHGVAARLKPAAQYLGVYYLWLSVGGALGGLLGVAAPYLFSDVYEYYGVALLSLVALRGNAEFKRRTWIYILVLMLLCTANIIRRDQRNDIIHQSRNFFGVSRVINTEDARLFKHGTTLHGLQFFAADKAHLVTTYYTPINRLLNALPASMHDKPFGVIGLGAGTLACLGTKRQEVDFFEIDPAVIAIAKNPEYFTYVSDCAPKTNLIEGDGRLMVAKQPPHRYNLLVLDAFTSDSVPMHLLTTEAMAMYISRLDPKNGILAVHVSNRHMDLTPFVGAAIANAGWLAYSIDALDTKGDPLASPSLWVIALPPHSPWQSALTTPTQATLIEDDQRSVWTDDYSNLFWAIR